MGNRGNVEHLRGASPASWDVVVIDVYDGSGFVRDFGRSELLHAIRRSLREGGALACNVIGTLERGDGVADFVTAARAVFGEVRLLPVVAVDEAFSRDALRNVVVVAKRPD